MIARLIVQTVVWFGVMGALLFLAAGTVNWPAAWLYLGLMLLLSLATGLWLARHDPGLLRERLAGPIQKNQPPADKVVLTLIFIAIFGLLALTGLDAVRFGWSAMPVWVQVIGAALVALGIGFSYRTMRENSFAAPVVKIQADRGQRVITTGPYAYVRHPFYTGALLYLAGTSLMLGSWWGLLAVVLVTVLLAIRIGIEEQTLRRGLEGYDDYARRVAYRLVPFVW
jgi:protein-S-isoprenylcysteine O-methyltransferase Ste14